MKTSYIRAGSAGGPRWTRLRPWILVFSTEKLGFLPVLKFDGDPAEVHRDPALFPEAAAQGNLIGVDLPNAAFLPNGQDGITIGGSNNVVGGTLAGEGNVIAGNTRFGMDVWSGGVNNFITGNSFYNNGSFGIDLGADTQDTNDPLDVDGGENGHQNYPLLSMAVSAGGNTQITGTLNSAANKAYRIEFFSSPTPDPSGWGEGKVYLGALTGITTNGTGTANFTANLTGVSVTPGHVVSATATDPALNTSEFSATRSVTAGFNITGTVFEDVNYGGGAGRSKTTALSNGGTGRSNARVELFDGSGNYVTFTTTNASGDYSFTGLFPATYTVRVLNSTVSSSRSGILSLPKKVLLVSNTVS